MHELTADDTNGMSDVFVHERPTVTTQPRECIAPTTTASATTSSGAAYVQGTWTNKDVKVTFSAQDNQGGSGLKDILYLADGAQSLPLDRLRSTEPADHQHRGHNEDSLLRDRQRRQPGVWQDLLGPAGQDSPRHGNSLRAFRLREEHLGQLRGKQGYIREWLDSQLPM